MHTTTFAVQIIVVGMDDDTVTPKIGDVAGLTGLRQASGNIRLRDMPKPTSGGSR
jgi:hypothetical protein